MLSKTHLAITLCFVLLFLNVVEYKLVFVIVALFATLIPDIDTKFSTLGRKKFARAIGFFVKHRGMFHSFSFLLAVTIVLILFWPVGSLGFFLGYGLHLFADSFTRTGIRGFYPYKKKTKGKVKTGSRIETGIFVVFLILDIGLILMRIGIFY